MNQADLIWMNGELVPYEDAKVHVLTHALHYGTGVFEGVRAYETPRGTAIFRHDDHLDRLYKSAALMLRHGLSREDSAASVESAVDRALDAGLRTRDLGGTATTAETTEAVLKELRT